MSAHISSIDAALHSHFKQLLIVVTKIGNKVRFFCHYAPALSEMVLLLCSIFSKLFESISFFVCMPRVVKTVVLEVMARSSDQSCETIKIGKLSFHGKSLIALQD